MGKTARWFRALLGAKKSADSQPASTGSDSRPGKEKKRWGAVRSSDGNRGAIGGTRGSSAEVSSSSSYVEPVDANKHAIAVAAATAAVAEAALAAAKAAAEVVRLTSGGGRPAPVYVSGSERRREWAAVKIQSAFRAYLARRALRALKGLVKLQALVRGHIVRKQSTNMLRRMQAMARIQARASASRAFMSESPYSSSKSSQSHNPRYGAKSNIKDIVDLERKRSNSNWLDHWMEEFAWDGHRNTGCGSDEKSDKILEVDTWKPRFISERGNMTSQSSNHVSRWNYYEPGFTNLESLSRHTTKSHKPNPSLSSGEVLSMKSVKLPTDAEAAARTTESSPQMYSALSRPGSSARKGPFTPTRSECMQSYFSGYSSHPNYMANTESSRAKVRSQSAPKQRMQFDSPGSSSTKRSLHGIWDADTRSEVGFDLHANLRNKAYPGLSRLRRLERPSQGGTGSVNGGRC